MNFEKQHWVLFVTILIKITWEQKRRSDPTYPLVLQYLLVSSIMTARTMVGRWVPALLIVVHIIILLLLVALSRYRVVILLLQREIHRGKEEEAFYFLHCSSQTIHTIYIITELLLGCSTYNLLFVQFFVCVCTFTVEGNLWASILVATF